MPGGFEIPLTVRLTPEERFEITSFCAAQIRKLAKGLPVEARKNADEERIEFYTHLHDKVCLGNQLAGAKKLKRKKVEAARQEHLNGHRREA